jgi:ribosome maturation factor RimP
LYQPLDAEKQYQGTLLSLTKDELVLKIRIKTREKELVIDRKNVAKARLAIQF